MADPTSTDKSASTDPPAEPASPETPVPEDPAADMPLLLAETASATPELTAPVAAQAPVSEPPTSAAAHSEPAPQRSVVARDTRVKPLKLMMLLVLFGITGVGSLMLLASSIRGPEDRTGASPPNAGAGPAAKAKATAGPAAVENAVAPAGTAVAPALEPEESVARPRWSASTNSRKAGYGNNIVFELAADEDVEMWRKRVRPVLTMRCVGRTAEVFIVTQAPAAIEGSTNRHTVKIAFDGREPSEQLWEHSIDHDALFAPNGVALMRQITRSREMSFSFAPFNAPPATVTFSTAGFDAHAKAAASRCPAVMSAERAPERGNRRNVR